MKKKHELRLGTRLVGWLWLVAALIMLAVLLKAGSGSKPVQWVHATFVFLTGMAGIVAGIATGLGHRWGARVLLSLSWIGVVYFVGWGLAGAFIWALSRINPLISLVPLVVVALPAYLFSGFVIALSLGLRSDTRPADSSYSPS